MSVHPWTLSAGRLLSPGPADAVWGGPGWLAWKGPAGLIVNTINQDIVINGPDGFTVDGGPHWLCLRADGTPALWVDLPDVQTTLLPAISPTAAIGAQGVRVRQGHRLHQVELPSLRPVQPALPEGAAGRQVLPWSSGRGWSWWDEDMVFRRGATGPVLCIGRCPVRPDRLIGGPDGAVLVQCPGLALLSGPRSGLRPLQRPGTVEAIHWSPDGAWAHILLSSEHGLARGWQSTDSGAWVDGAGAGIPIDHRRHWDPDEHHILDGEAIALAGLQSWPSATVGDRVFGPSGAVWTGPDRLPMAVTPDADDILVACGGGVVLLGRRTLHTLGPDGAVRTGPHKLPRALGRPLDAVATDAVVHVLGSRTSMSLDLHKEAWTRLPSAAVFERPTPPPHPWLHAGGVLLAPLDPAGATRR